jgi:galactonate dehydratase
MVYNAMNGWPIDGMREHTHPEKLAEFLLERGIRGIKIYPYDRGPVNALAQHGGTFITQSELKKSLDPIQRIRKAAGDEIEIALDLSSRWNLPCSMQIAHSLEPYGILWLEDPMLADNLSAYTSLARATSIPICISERLATRYRFREMFEQHAVGVVMYDVTWCGGISEAKKISDMADTYKIPTAPHTGGGPILWYSSIHTAASLTNFYILESVYHLYNDVSALPQKRSRAGERLRDAARCPWPGHRNSRRGVSQRRCRDRDDRRIVILTEIIKRCRISKSPPSIPMPSLGKSVPMKESVARSFAKT